MSENNKFDPGKQYDEYYAKSKDGKESIYSKQYHGVVIPRDEAMLLDQAKKCLKNVKGDTLRILDHGFGDGRYFSVIEKIAREAEKKGKSVELIAYEPSLSGLRNFAEEQEERGYSGVDKLKFKDISKIKHNDRIRIDGYSAGTISKGNLKVKFVHNDIGDSIDHTKKLIGNVGMTMSMFGVLSHIPKRKTRQNILKLFNDITDKNGKVVVTLPSASRFQKEQEGYELMRKHDSHSPSSAAREPGDLYYCKFSNTDEILVKNFYHVYKADELKEDLKVSGLKVDGHIESNHTLDIKMLTANPLLAHVDAFVSWLTPACLVDSCASYMSAVSSPQKEIKVDKGFTDNKLLASARHIRGGSLGKSQSWAGGLSISVHSKSVT